jgi:hypothetical protein
MNIILRMHVFLIALSTVFLAGCMVNTIKPTDASTVAPRSSNDIDSASNYVAIDQSERAFTVFTGIPKNIEASELERVKKQVLGQDSLTLLNWGQFLESVNEYARSVILINGYPNYRIVDGIVCLVASKQGSGAPWGLTWNGGIALTRMDYNHARRTYESYKADPASYRAIRDPRGDPVNPGGHLPFGGCN